MKIAVVGHICLDIIPNWLEGNLCTLKPGHTLEMNGIDISLGGAVSNTGLALSKLGASVKLVGKVGRDELGEIVEEKIQKSSPSRVENNLVKSDKFNTSYSIVLSPPDTDRFFLHDPGLNSTFSSRDVDFTLLQNCEAFHFGYPPIMKKIYKDNGQELLYLYQNAREKGMITSLDLAMPDPNSPAALVNWENFLAKTLPLVDVFIPSLEELIFMIDYSNYHDFFCNGSKKISVEYLNNIACKLLDFGAKIVVLKLGEKGIYLRTKQLSIKEQENTPLLERLNLSEWSECCLYTTNFKVQVKGTTGAGDCAAAGFLIGLLQEYSPERALNLAAATGACCVEEVDATTGLRSLAEIEKKINCGWERSAERILLNNWEKIEPGLWRQDL